MFEFGSGTLFGVPIGGNEGANPTPMKFGTLQDVSLDISGDIKELFGQKQFPEAVARGKVKVTGKAKFAHINGKQLNDIFFGQTLNASGPPLMAIDEAHTIPTTPFQVTIAPPGSGTYINDSRGDQGVIYSSGANAGKPLTRVASGPVTGQYSVATSTGIYTFAAADTGLSVVISYMYTISSSPGTQLNITNQLMGFAPTVQMALEQQYNNNQLTMILWSVLCSKLNFATKQEDFTIPELDFEAFANAAGQVIDIYSAE